MSLSQEEIDRLLKQGASEEDDQEEKKDPSADAGKAEEGAGAGEEEAEAPQDDGDEEEKEKEEIQGKDNEETGPLVERVQFAQLKESSPQKSKEKKDMTRLIRIPMKVAAELGKTNITVRELLALEKDSVLPLDKMAGESVTLLANKQPFAEGEVVVLNENYAVRVTNLGLKKNQEDK